MKFAIEMLPANEGDCLLLEFDDAGRSGRTARVLIDGGRKATWNHLKERLTQIPPEERELDLLVVTHVDRDHIEGVITMLEDRNCPVTFKDVWFNGFRHLNDDESFGPVMGERLTTALLSRRWNGAVDGKGRAIRVCDDGSLPTTKFPSGLTLTVLSPTRLLLQKMVPVWEKECRRAGLDPSQPTLLMESPGDEAFGPIDVDALADEPFQSDAAAANGTSIALLAEYDGRKVLLGGDAHAGVLVESLKKYGGGAKVSLDAWKVAHHGSRANTSQLLLERAICHRYLVSTSGAYFEHPDRQAIARIVKYGNAREIIFNYRSKQTEIWEGLILNEHDCTAHFCADTTPGFVRIEL